MDKRISNDELLFLLKISINDYNTSKGTKEKYHPFVPFIPKLI